MNLYLQAGETWAQCPWWFIWTLAAFLLGSLLTWLLTRREKVDTTPLINERDRYHKLSTKWEKDYQEVKYRLDESLKTQADLRAGLQRCDADKQTLKYRAEKAEANLVAGGRITDKDSSDKPSSATGVGAPPVAASRISSPPTTGAAYGDLFDSDELQVIEGIGPRVTEVLRQAGYTTWATLADANVNDLRDMLAAAGSRYALSDPSSWPQQAQLAADGDWDALVQYQKMTDTSRETSGGSISDSKLEKLSAKRLGFSSANSNDLKVVDGIGPKIEKMLKEAGIADWQALATTDPATLTELLSTAGSRYRLTSTDSWPQQATLAAAGDWQGLKAYQQAHRKK